MALGMPPGLVLKATTPVAFTETHHSGWWFPKFPPEIESNHSGCFYWDSISEFYPGEVLLRDWKQPLRLLLLRRQFFSFFVAFNFSLKATTPVAFTETYPQIHLQYTLYWHWKQPSRLLLLRHKNLIFFTRIKLILLWQIKKNAKNIQ